MTFVLLIAMDTMRSVRRHRVMLAFLLVAVAGMGLVTIGIRNASRHATQVEQMKPHAPDGAGEQPDQAALESRLREITMVFNGFFGLALSFVGSLLSLVLFCTIVSSEVLTGTIRVTLAKPVPRSAYLLGKFLGAAGVLAAYSLITGVAAAVLGVTYGVHGTATLVSIPWLAFWGNLMLGAVGLLYSLFVRAPIAGVLAWFTSATWVGAFRPLYAILPSYEPFDVWRPAMFGTTVGIANVVLPTLYAADVAAILLLAAFLRFRRMEIA
jgi:ABC-type transport system involved in multi-copper enzyme maturation permease subunit